MTERDNIIPDIEAGSETVETENETQAIADDAPGDTGSTHKKNLLRIILPVAAAMLLAAAGILFRHDIAYSYAKWRFDSKDYSVAKDIFEGLGDFGDSRAYINNIDFIDALGFMEAGDYWSAICLFRSLEGYAVSKKLIKECYSRMADDYFAGDNFVSAFCCYSESGNDEGIRKTCISWGDSLYNQNDYAGAIEKWLPYAGDADIDSRISRAEYELAFIASQTGRNYEAVIKLNSLNYDGRTHEAVDALLPMDAADARTLAVGGGHVVYLASDGIVRADGDDSHGQCGVDGWMSVVSLCASELNTYGLVYDGTVLAAGSNSFGQCNVSDWTDITAVCATDSAVFGLKDDGTVVFTGGEPGQYDATLQWTDIVSVSAGKDHVAAVDNSGTVYTTGKDDYGQCDITVTEKVSRAVCGPYRTIIIYADGSACIFGVCSDEIRNAVSCWEYIADVSSSYSHVAAMDDSGKLFAAGENSRGQCNVSDWNGIAQFAASGNFTIAVNEDGSVLTSIAGHSLDWSVLVWR